MDRIELQNMISQRFISLISEVEYVLQEMNLEEQQFRASRDRVKYILHAGEYLHCETKFSAIRTKTLSLLQFLPTNGNHINLLAEEIRKIESKISGLEKMTGILKGLQNDFEAGFLRRYSDFIEAEIEADYFQQAEQLLGPKEDYSHIPAAVLLGAILEDTLRRLCQRQSPQIPILKPNGDFKMMGALIDDLKQAGAFNELKAKQLRAWADIRNSAAHGKFGEFTQPDVEQMLVGVRNFLADFMA
jgi:hypothetical protein